MQYSPAEIIEHMPFLFFLKDTRNNILKVNTLFCKTANKTKEQLENKSCEEIFGKTLADIYYQDDLQVIQSGKPKTGIIELMPNNGNRWYRTEKHPLLNNTGHIVGILGFSVDIHDEMIYAEKSAKFVTAANQSPSIIVMTDVNNNITYVNPKFTRVTGYTESEVIGKVPHILKSGKTRGDIYTVLWKTLQAGKVWRGEFLNRTKSGKYYWEIASISPIKDMENKTIGYIKVAEVASEMKLTLLNMWNILDHSDYFVVVWDENMVIRMCNDSVARALGYEHSTDLIGYSWQKFVDAIVNDVTSIIQKKLTSEAEITYQEFVSEIVDKQGKKHIVRWFSTLVKNDIIWTFNLGIPLQHEEDPVNTEEQIRGKFINLLARDRTIINTLKSAASK